METHDETSTILHRAEELNRQRLEALAALAELLTERRELAQQVATVDAKYREVYAAAQKAGWTPDQLSEMDVPSPEPKRRGRPPKRRQSQPVHPRPRTEGTSEQ